MHAGAMTVPCTLHPPLLLYHCSAIRGVLLLVFADSIEYISLDDSSFDDLTETLADVDNPKVLLLNVSIDRVEGNVTYCVPLVTISNLYMYMHLYLHVHVW